MGETQREYSDFGQAVWALMVDAGSAAERPNADRLAICLRTLRGLSDLIDAAAQRRVLADRRPQRSRQLRGDPNPRDA